MRRVRLVDSVEDEYLLRVEWEPSYAGVLNALVGLEIPPISVTGTDDRWTFEIRGDDRGDVAAFQRLCRDRDISITLTALHALTPVETGGDAAITETQEEALVLAYRRGYFDSPRDVTMDELGDELGISQQAVASRLRRGLRRILGQTLSPLSTRDP